MPKKRTGKRRVRGTGALFAAPSRGGLYIGRVQIGRYPNGKPKYTQASAATVAALQAKLDAVKPPADDTTLRAWLTRWLSEMKCKPGTRRNRESVVNTHLIPSLGHLPVATVTARQIEVAASKWKLEPTSARHALSILGSAIRAAVRHDLRPDNPVRAAVKPKGKKKKIDPFTLDEVERIVALAVQRPHTRALALVAGTALRSGECLALDVPDIDTKNWTVSVTKNLDSKNRNAIGTPKTENSVRVIEIPDAPPGVRQAVLDAIGNRTAGPLFLSARKLRMVDHTLTGNWKTLLKRLGIRQRGKHQLRHTVASHQLAAGVPVTEVAKYLGNTPQETLKTYSHATGAVNPAQVYAGLFKGRESAGRVTRESENVTKRKKTQSKRRK